MRRSALHADYLVYLVASLLVVALAHRWSNPDRKAGEVRYRSICVVRHHTVAEVVAVGSRAATFRDTDGALFMSSTYPARVGSVIKVRARVVVLEDSEKDRSEFNEEVVGCFTGNPP